MLRIICGILLDFEGFGFGDGGQEIRNLGLQTSSGSPSVRAH